MRVFFLQVFFTLLVAGSLYAQQSLTFEQIRAVTQKYMADTGYVGLAIGIIDAQGFHKYNFGVKGKGSSDSITSGTIFEIGSITKTFTGLLYTIFINKGLLSPEDYIDKYLPSSAQLPIESRNKIKLWNLVTHTSGFPKLPGDFFDKADFNSGNPYINYDTTDLYKYLSTFIVQHPSKKAAYSNLGVGLLGIILEEKSKSTLQSLIDKEICSPLKMKNTFFDIPNNFDSLNLAKGYNNGKQVLNWDFDAFAGAGALKSNMDDMLLYLSENIKPAGTDSLISSILKSHEKLYKFNCKNDIATCWLIRKARKGKKILWHDGGTGGFRSFIAFEPLTKTGVIILSNSTNPVMDMGFSIIKKLSGIKR
jgi:CubicO group peptidase (beta-lactamase class C family)